MRKISIVIPCRNEEKYISACIDSIFQSGYPNEFLEVFVCDGLSTDNTREIVNEQIKKYSQLHLVDNTRQITPVALNLGIKKSSGDLIMILGAHTKLSSDYLSDCVKIFDIDPKIACVGGVIENHFENKVSEIISNAMSVGFGVGTAYFRTGKKDGYVDTVAFGMFRREIFQEIGYFDEDLVRNQDDEFSFRLINAGYKIYLSTKTKISYYVRATYGNLFRQYMQYGFWKVYVNKKHKTITTLRQLVPFIFVLYLVLGLFASILYVPLSVFYIAGIFCYLLVSMTFSIKLSAGLSDIFKYIFVFAILHVGYGWGYLSGFLRFIVFRKKPSEAHGRLSR
jgi:cellulose synthase/poly-beta-1,6-N-acetylglucosamine synthase-like glycosyltransferase